MHSYITKLKTVTKAYCNPRIDRSGVAML